MDRYLTHAVSTACNKLVKVEAFCKHVPVEVAYLSHKLDQQSQYHIISQPQEHSSVSGCHGMCYIR